MNKAKLISKRQLTETIFELTFETERMFDFIPGQYISIKIDDNKSAIPCFRAYSIPSTPNGNTFELCIKTVENGRGSNWIANSKEGSEIEFIGPLGKFIHKDDGSKNVIFLAVGIGIAPIKSLIESELKKGNKNDMHLIFGIRYIKDIFYKDFFEALEKRHPNFKFTLVLSRPESASWKGPKGHVTNILEKLFTPSTTSAYICGLAKMIEDSQNILLKKGVPREKIYFEKF